MNECFAYLLLFLAGVASEKYIFPLLDILIGIVANWYTVKTAESQVEIESLGLAESCVNQIGFVLDTDEADFVEDC